MGGTRPAIGSTFDAEAGSNAAAIFFKDPPPARSAKSSAEHRLGGPVGGKILDPVDRQDLREAGARPVHPALDRADPAAADLRGFLVGGSGPHHQAQGFALVGTQF